jgi:hypothetical protein
MGGGISSNWIRQSGLSAALKVVALTLCFAAGCGSETEQPEAVGSLQQATTGVPDPPGSPGAGCGRFVEQQPNGSVRHAIKFPQPQAYVEVFVRQNGVQNIAQNIVASAVANGDGTFTYSLIKPASQYHADDITSTSSKSRPPTS